MARGDLTDEQWQRLEPLLPPERSGKRGHPYKGHRTVINGILWIDRTGAPWRDLPERYGPHQTCSDRLYRWRRKGIWQQVLQALQSQEDARSNVEWEGCAIDSTSIKAHPHAAGARHAPAKADQTGEPPASEAQAQKGGPKHRLLNRRRKRPPLRRTRGPRPRRPWGAAEAD